MPNPDRIADPKRKFHEAAASFILCASGDTTLNVPKHGCWVLRKFRGGNLAWSISVGTENSRVGVLLGAKLRYIYILARPKTFLANFPWLVNLPSNFGKFNLKGNRTPSFHSARLTYKENTKEGGSPKTNQQKNPGYDLCARPTHLAVRDRWPGQLNLAKISVVFHSPLTLNPPEGGSSDGRSAKSPQVSPAASVVRTGTPQPAT